MNKAVADALMSKLVWQTEIFQGVPTTFAVIGNNRLGSIVSSPFGRGHATQLWLPTHPMQIHSHFDTIAGAKSHLEDLILWWFEGLQKEYVALDTRSVGDAIKAGSPNKRVSPSKMVVKRRTR